MAKHVVVSLSGGMDSSTLLLRALKEYDTVTGISFDYGQNYRQRFLSDGKLNKHYLHKHIHSCLDVRRLYQDLYDNSRK